MTRKVLCPHNILGKSSCRDCRNKHHYDYTHRVGSVGGGRRVHEVDTIAPSEILPFESDSIRYALRSERSDYGHDYDFTADGQLVWKRNADEWALHATDDESMPPTEGALTSDIFFNTESHLYNLYIKDSKIARTR